MHRSRMLDLRSVAVLLPDASCRDRAVFYLLPSTLWLHSFPHSLAKATIDPSRLPSLITNPAFIRPVAESECECSVSTSGRMKKELIGNTGLVTWHSIFTRDGQRKKRVILFRQWCIQNFISHTTRRPVWVLLWVSWTRCWNITKQTRPVSGAPGY